MRYLMAWLVLLCSLALPTAAAAQPPNTDRLARLQTALREVRFVAYTPTDLAIWNGRVAPASATRIEQDLRRLRGDFRGLITYSCANGVEQVPAIAARLGFRAVIVGVWDPASAAELAAAIGLARRYPRLVIAIAVGNETLLARRLPWPALRAALEQVRRAAPGVAVTTSEPFYYYLNNDPPDFLAAQDFLLPSVHPLYQPWFPGSTVETDVEFVTQVLDKLAALTTKPILVKETGLPSGPAQLGFAPERQAEFWRLLTARIAPDAHRAFAYFEAYDQAWKADNARREFGFHAEEGYWGLYDAAGHAKPALIGMRRLWGGQGH